MADAPPATTEHRHMPRAGGSPWRLIAFTLLGAAVVLVETASAAARNRVVRELAALGVLTTLVLAQFSDALTRGLVAFQNDTQVFYYPLELWFGQEFKAGRFPLWNPYLFAGYPIFADGELGLSYPLHLLLLQLLPVASAFIWLRISTVLVAAFAMYALGRALALRRMPAMLGAIAFSLGSFFLAQQHHENVTRTAAWIPLILAGTEWALRHRGWRRHVFLTVAAIALGMAGRGLHPQVLAMGLLTFATHVIYRIALGPLGPGRSAGQASSWPAETGPRLRAFVREAAVRVGLVIWVGGYVGALGLALAAIQLFPLAEIGLATFRGSQPDYSFATSYALPMQNLINLVFPYFFRAADSEYWSLWAKWETTVYVGIVPLVLGLLGATVGRRREVGYFLLLAVGSLWLGFADYAPVDLYHALWSLPGFSSFRVPGRYILLFVLAWSALAAIGLQAIGDAAVRQRTHRAWRASHSTPALPELGAASRSVPALLGLRAASQSAPALAVLFALGVSMPVGLWLMAHLRAGLIADQAAALTWIRESYLSLRNHGQGIEAQAVYDGLVYSLSTGNPRTAFALVTLIVAVVLCLGVVLAPKVSRVLQLGLVACTAIDLLLFGVGFHQKMPIGQLVRSTPAIQFLAQAGGALDAGGERGDQSWRVFTPGTIPSLEFDRLVPFRVEEIGGYSSLQPKRHFTYWTIINDVGNRLLDVANVRYVVFPRTTPALPSYANVPFDPERPLMLGSKDAIGGFEAYRMDGARGHRVQLIGALTRAIEIPDGDPVVGITVVARDGRTVELTLLAGRDLAEWASSRPDVQGRLKHARPATIAFRRPTVSPIDGQRYDYELYYAERDLPGEMEVDRIEIRAIHPLGGVEIYGIGLYNFDAEQTTGVTSDMRAKLHQVYEDPEVRIFQNADLFSRAYVVPSGRFAGGEDSALGEMLDTPFDPAREVMLEEEATFDVQDLWDRERARARDAASRAARPVDPANISPGLTETGPGSAVAVVSETDRLVYRARAPQGGYLVHVASMAAGWRAWVDGREAPVYRANSLFRAVPIPPGEHEVELRYEPGAVGLGRTVSTWATMGALLSLVLAGLTAKFQTWGRSRRG
jgi:hypothetical protein